MKSLKVGSIILDQDGTWWYYGLGPGTPQDGYLLGPYNRGGDRLGVPVDFLNENTDKILEILENKIKEKE